MIIKGPWSSEEIAKFLHQATYPVRVASHAADGFPRVVSLWYRYHDGRLHCVTHRDAALVKLLRADNRVGFEVSPNEPPYFGVRGQGQVQLEPLAGRNTLQELLERYLGGTDSSLATWLMSRSDEELLLTIEPNRLYSWDYRRRMADAVDSSPG